MTRTCEHPGCTTRLRSTRSAEDVYCSAHETALVETEKAPTGERERQLRTAAERRERVVELIDERGRRSFSELMSLFGISRRTAQDDILALIASGRIERVRKGDQRAPSVYRVVPSADELDELMGSAA